MNKSLFLSVLLFTSLYSDAKTYVGLNFGAFNEKFSNLEAQNSAPIVTLKVGYGDIKAYAIEFSVDRVKNSSNIFSKNDGNKYALNIELIKAFDFDIFTNPFFKIGFGTGRLNIARKVQDNLYSGSFNLGFGSFIPITSNIDLEIGYNYRYITYEKVDNISNKISYKSNVNIIYSGLNMRF